jgi:hypothetical protein
MNYAWHYEQLIKKHGSWKKPKTGYVERHRKLPGYLGGRYSEGNAFYMSARAHYIAHLLWAKITGHEKAWMAVKLMGAKLDRNNSKLYEVARTVQALYISELFSGENHPQFGKSPSEETRKKMSEASKGKPKSLEMRKNLSETNKGHSVTDSTRSKLSASHSGKKMSSKFRQLLSERMKGNKHLLGYTHSEETKRKISEKLNGKKHTEETRKKISDSRTGEKNPMYGRTSPRYGVKLSDETKQKISEARLRRNNNVVA